MFKEFKDSLPIQRSGLPWKIKIIIITRMCDDKLSMLRVNQGKKPLKCKQPCSLQAGRLCISSTTGNDGMLWITPVTQVKNVVELLVNNIVYKVSN